uniref:Uncharacterized protein n=1 Tax=Trichogramma kaykai TaxID=54128 RepID=A0ABD2WPF8_9HYME
MPGRGTISERCLRDLSAVGGRPTVQAEERKEIIVERESQEQDAWSQGDFVTLELGGEIEEPPRETRKEIDMRMCDEKTCVVGRKSGEVVVPCERPRGDFSTPKPTEGPRLDVASKGKSRKKLRSVGTVESDRVSTLEERLNGEEFSRGKRVTFKPRKDCTRGAIPRNTNRRDPTSGGVSSDTAKSAVCRSRTQSLVSREYNSDEDIECLDSYIWRRRRLQRPIRKKEPTVVRGRRPLLRQLPRYMSSESRSGAHRCDRL